jgi:hypothetical protein
LENKINERIFNRTVFSAADQSTKGGIVFKIPEDVFPMDWNKNNFKGILMLRKDSPSGIFIAYPNEGEKLEDLRERAAKFIAPMFVHDENKKKEIEFQKSPIPVHKGDIDNSGLYYSYENEKAMTQILFYERESNGRKVIYGYFANKNKDAKAKSVKDIWADDKGQGVKIFEKFWKTFKE